MLNQQIVDYLKKERAAGYDDQKLKKVLLDSGYKKEEIEEAIAFLDGKEPKTTENLGQQATQKPSQQQPSTMQPQTGQQHAGQQTGQQASRTQPAQTASQQTQAQQSPQAPSVSQQSAQQKAAQAQNSPQPQAQKQTPIGQLGLPKKEESNLDKVLQTQGASLPQKGGIKKRNPTMVLVLSLVPIINIFYILFWYISTAQELKEEGQDVPHYLLVVVPFVNFFFLWKLFGAVEQKTGYSATTLFILSLFLPPVALYLAQKELNK